MGIEGERNEVPWITCRCLNHFKGAAVKRHSVLVLLAATVIAALTFLFVLASNSKSEYPKSLVVLSSTCFLHTARRSHAGGFVQPSSTTNTIMQTIR